jgi:peptidoglycan/xylan/chitin deacetylase (PgdA/CDA1 family)
MNLDVVAYHYVRDLPRTRYPRIKGLMLDAFRAQVRDLAARYEMATLDMAVDFLAGRTSPARPLCLLTFDDGLKEHYREVTPILLDAGVQGCFFPATSCLEGAVASVHKMHFLMAALDFHEYRRAFLDALRAVSPQTIDDVPVDEAARCYPWDTREVGAFKYLANFLVPPPVRDAILGDLFARHFGDEAAFAADLYVSWGELREMQDHGMVIGGHSHAHSALSNLTPAEQASDLARSIAVLRKHLRAQVQWPFAYPYGWHDDDTVAIVARLGFACAFTVEAGSNHRDQDPFRIRRFDTNQFLPRGTT